MLEQRLAPDGLSGMHQVHSAPGPGSIFSNNTNNVGRSGGSFGDASLTALITDFDFQLDDLIDGATATAYRHLLETSGVIAREELYEYLLSGIAARCIDAKSLLAFVIFEPHRRLAARAVQDFLACRQCDVIDEFAGVREVMRALAEPGTANRGAVLAGLVLVCDRRINAIARTARSLLSPSDIRDFSRVQLTTIQRCNVEFCLDWLVELTQNYARGPVEDLACALMLMVVHDEHGVVEDESEIDYLVGFNSTRVRQFASFESYYEEVLPILHYLRSFESFEAPVSSVIDCWEGHREAARQLRG